MILESDPLILIADDDERFREIFRDALETRGHRVIATECPDEAVRLSLDTPVSVVLLDNRFPNDGDGLVILARIKEHRPEVEVIMLTAFGDDGSALDAVRADAYAFLPKSGDLERLRSTVDRCLEMIALKRRNAELAEKLRERNAELETLTLSLRQWNESLVERVRAHERRLGLGDRAGEGLPLDADTRFVIESFLHEINNRVQLLSPGYLRLLFRDAPAQAREIDAVARIFDHIRGLTVDFKRLLANDGEERTTVPVELVARRVTIAVLLLARKAKVELREHHAADSGMIHCNPHQLACALFNLLKNAVEAVEALPDPAARIVEFRGLRAGGEIEWTVRDTGPELSEESRARLFEKYFTTKAGGTGIGLALTRRIVEAHGGTIDFFREEGWNGFRIRLPPAGKPPERAGSGCVDRSGGAGGGIRSLLLT